MEIEVNNERESTTQWAYDVRLFSEGRTRDFEVTLSFADYDHWSHGRVPPSRVVESIFKFLLDRESESSILSRFDCAMVRRYFPEVDEKLTGYF